MAEQVKVGDIVLSTYGHDKGNYFAVTFLEGNKAFIADGRNRKFQKAKIKNIKHLKSVSVSIPNEIVGRIQAGQPVGNQVLFKAIKSQIENKQED